MSTALTRQEVLKFLTVDQTNNRLRHLEELAMRVRQGLVEAPQSGKDVNNHIHSTYSFSPYSPAAAAWFAHQAGLDTAGLMDHDTVAGAREFIEAGRMLGMAVTVGMECRVKLRHEAIAGVGRINNPDQDGIAYMGIHGIPHIKLDRVQAHFAKYRALRGERNRKMLERMNALTAPCDIILDYDKDVLPLSMQAFGGSVTERHLGWALAQKLLCRFGQTPALLEALAGLGIKATQKLEAALLNGENEHAPYDLLGLIKSDLVPRFYIDADEECPPAEEVIALCEEVSAISAYAYLGDVEQSVTGDKRAQKFEDDYLESLFVAIKVIGFRAVTYMPSRNTRQQLERLRDACVRHGLMQISGEDINSSRQQFVCQAMRDPYFDNLTDAAWALIAHEKRATLNKEWGLFSKEAERCYPVLDDRIAAFAQMARDEFFVEEDPALLLRA